MVFGKHSKGDSSLVCVCAGFSEQLVTYVHDSLSIQFKDLCRNFEIFKFV